MAFLEERLPFPVSRQSAGGPAWQTTVVAVSSGYEQRNQSWAEELGRWDIGSFIDSVAALNLLRAFFLKTQGRTHGFRLEDWQDNQLGTQPIGTGDGVRTTYQLFKTYDPTPGAYQKRITKPVPGTLVVHVASVLQVEDTHYTADYTTGVVTFLPGAIPPAAAGVTASCTFDKPARFDFDHLNIEHVHLPFGTLAVPIVELRIP